MRNRFELDPSLIYLNAANLSPCPTNVLNAVTRYQRDFERNPTEGLRRAWDEIARVQSELAAFLNARSEDLFLRENVTAVLNLFLMGIPLPPQSELLVTEHEYGAILNICRLRAERDGHAWRVLQLPSTPHQYRHLEDDALVDLVVSQLSPKTKLFLMSHVMSGTGLVMPLEKIARETRRRGIFLVVDGAYAPGALDVDFSKLEDVDFYGCSLYKWMLGPKGTAFGWVAPSRQPLLQPTTAGWKTFDGNFQKAFLFSGCRDFAPFRAISETLELWKEVGPDTIRSRMKRLRDIVDKELGWTALHTNGPMTAYLIPTKLQPEGPNLVDKILREARVQVGSALLRGKWYLVFSPHVHNAEEEVREAIRRIRQLTA